MRVEFVPPKPKELDRKVSKGLSIVRAGIQSLEESSSGCSKLMFPAMKPLFIIRIE